MTMPAYDEDVPGLRELHRTIVDFRDEWRNQMGGLVRKDVHVVEHDSLLSRIATLERDRDNTKAESAKEWASMKNRMWGLIFSVAGTLIVAAILAASQ